MRSLTIAIGTYALKNRAPLIVALIPLFAFSPFVTLRFEFHDG